MDAPGPGAGTCAGDSGISLLQAETGMTEEENADKLAKIFDVDDFCYLKGKAERVLRRHAENNAENTGSRRKCIFQYLYRRI